MRAELPIVRFAMARLPEAKLRQPWKWRHQCRPCFSMPKRIYILKPGADALESFEDGRGRDLWQLATWVMAEHWYKSPGREDPIDVRVTTLHALDHYLEMTVWVTEPAPIRRLDSSGRWKSAPPSRRRHMKSWRHAPYQEKLWHAPLCRNGRHPYGTDWRVWPRWALHPHQLRRVNVGAVVVDVRLRIFCQNGEHLDSHLRNFRRELQEEMDARLSRAELPPRRGS